jgi:SWI/SNF-related matrix-associated actin-dependent regulator of chromatin subfamily A3
MFLSLNFYDLSKKSMITSVYAEKYGEVIEKLSQKDFIDNKIKKGDYHDLEMKSSDLPEIKDMKRIQLKISSLKSYQNFLMIEPTVNPQVVCFTRIVKLDKLNLLTNSLIFGYEDEKGYHDGDLFLRTLFSFHIKYQNLLISQMTEVFNYQLSLIIDNISKPRLYNLTKNDFLMEDIKLPLYNYQLDNLNWMMDREKNGIILPINPSRLYHLPDGRYYDYNNQTFISEEDYFVKSSVKFKSGIILDDVGIGKTFQMLSLIKSTPHLKTAILVPNHLKTHWENQMKKHFKTPFTNATIFTFDFYQLITKDYDRLIIDEIHEIFDRNIKIKNLPKIKYRWGLTATPFTKGCVSINGLLSYLTWNFDYNAEIVKYRHMIPIWNDLFRRNIRENIQDEIKIPPTLETNHFIKLNHDELSLYQTESMSYQNSIESLRRICCDVMMTINRTNGEKMSRDMFISRVIGKYKSNYETEVKNLEIINEKLEEIEKTLKNPIDFFKRNELKKNQEHYQNLQKKQKDIVESTKSQLEHISRCLNEEEECPICYDKITDKFAITKCRHFFCVGCVSHWLKTHSFCPACKTKTTSDELKIISKESGDGIKISSKMSKILNILNSSEEMFIIYTQYDYIIDKICELLNNLDIPTESLKKGSYHDFLEKKCRVLVVSSESSMAGIDLSFINNLIIYEPFVFHHQYLTYYERQIIGRISRLGQDKQCQVHRLICENTIEEKIYLNL